VTIRSEDHAIETFRSLVTISVEGLKTLVLLNGGAIVALLAYLGQAQSRQVLAAQIRCPIAWFVAGLIAGTIAFFGAYLTQLSLYNESVLGAKQRHHWALWLSFALCVISIAAFALGAFAALAAFSKQ
jgi:hypothetical protein